MTNENKIKEDILFIKNTFKEMRNKTEHFSKDRDFTMSNPQLFTFLYNVPAALSIASDGTVDEIEIAIIEKLARSIDVNKTVNINLLEMMSIAPEPDNCMTNEEFNLRVGSELLFLSRNMQKYERDFIEGIKALLKFDKHPEKDGSMTSALNKLMEFVIENNAGRNKEKELLKVKEYKKRIGIK
ncbi:MAG: hypothetical protein DRI94_10165 [Bacteroidetes bacterium]|nr:MAG: hypothetical protein DRI94_10165 [Bacteroidota bacterium]